MMQEPAFCMFSFGDNMIIYDILFMSIGKPLVLGGLAYRWNSLACGVRPVRNAGRFPRRSTLVSTLPQGLDASHWTKNAAPLCTSLTKGMLK